MSDLMNDDLLNYEIGDVDEHDLTDLAEDDLLLSDEETSNPSLSTQELILQNEAIKLPKTFKENITTSTIIDGEIPDTAVDVVVKENPVNQLLNIDNSNTNKNISYAKKTARSIHDRSTIKGKRPALKRNAIVAINRSPKMDEVSSTNKDLDDKLKTTELTVESSSPPRPVTVQQSTVDDDTPTTPVKVKETEQSQKIKQQTITSTITAVKIKPTTKKLITIATTENITDTKSTIVTKTPSKTILVTKPTTPTSMSTLNLNPEPITATPPVRTPPSSPAQMKTEPISLIRKGRKINEVQKSSAITTAVTIEKTDKTVTKLVTDSSSEILDLKQPLKDTEIQLQVEKETTKNITETSSDEVKITAQVKPLNIQHTIKPLPQSPIRAPSQTAVKPSTTQNPIKSTAPITPVKKKKTGQSIDAKDQQLDKKDDEQIDTDTITTTTGIVVVGESICDGTDDSDHSHVELEAEDSDENSVRLNPKTCVERDTKSLPDKIRRVDPINQTGAPLIVDDLLGINQPPIPQNSFNPYIQTNENLNVALQQIQFLNQINVQASRLLNPGNPQQILPRQDFRGGQPIVQHQLQHHHHHQQQSPQQQQHQHQIRPPFPNEFFIGHMPGTNPIQQSIRHSVLVNPRLPPNLIRGGLPVEYQQQQRLISPPAGVMPPHQQRPFIGSHINQQQNIRFIQMPSRFDVNVRPRMLHPQQQIHQPPFLNQVPTTRLPFTLSLPPRSSGIIIHAPQQNPVHGGTTTTGVSDIIPRKVLINPNFKGGVEAAKNQLLMDTYNNSWNLTATNDAELLRQQEAFIHQNHRQIEKRRHERSPERERERDRDRDRQRDRGRDRDRSFSPPRRDRRPNSRERESRQSYMYRRGADGGSDRYRRDGSREQNDDSRNFPKRRRSNSHERNMNNRRNEKSEDDEETKAYRLEIEKQKALREQILRDKEMRRRKAAVGKTKDEDITKPKDETSNPKLTPIVVTTKKIISLKKKNDSITTTTTTTAKPTPTPLNQSPVKFTDKFSTTPPHPPIAAPTTPSTSTLIQRTIPTAKILPESKKLSLEIIRERATSSTTAVIKPVKKILKIHLSPSQDEPNDDDDEDDDDHDHGDNDEEDDGDNDDDDEGDEGDNVRNRLDDEDVDDSSNSGADIDEDVLLADTPSPTEQFIPSIDKNYSARDQKNINVNKKIFTNRRVVLNSSSELHGKQVNAILKNTNIRKNIEGTNNKMRIVSKGIFDRLDKKIVGASNSGGTNNSKNDLVKRKIQRIVVKRAVD